MCKLEKKNRLQCPAKRKNHERKLCMMNTLKETRYKVEMELLRNVDLLLICVDELE
jgi:hypothetical protein